MNRRNFIGSLIAAVPAVALMRAAKPKPVVIVHEGPVHEAEFSAGTSTYYPAGGGENELRFCVTQHIGYYGRGT